MEACLQLSYDLLGWVRLNTLSIRAVHIPRKDNEAADIMSRGGPGNGDWSLNPLIVEKIWERFGEAQVDLFTSKRNTNFGSPSLPHWVWTCWGWCLGWGPFCRPCLRWRGWVRSLGRVRRTGASLILVAPWGNIKACFHIYQTPPSRFYAASTHGSSKREMINATQTRPMPSLSSAIYGMNESLRVHRYPMETFLYVYITI